MSGERIVALKSITKHYPGVVAVDDVDMDFHAGEIVGLVGKNGAGKSTVIRIMAGVETADNGILSIDGLVTAFVNTHQATDHGLAFVHQELNDVPMLSVAENILLGLGYPRRFGIAVDRLALFVKAARVLAKLHMKIAPERLVSTLSVAERRMVMIARALAQNAKLLVLDEPTASLTDREIDELTSVIRKLREDGVCIVYVSHRLQEVLDLTDRVVVMRDGKVVGGSVTSSLSEDALVTMIVGHAAVPGNAASERPSNGFGDVALEVGNIDPFNRGRAFSLSVKRGEVLGLAGLAGSGRTEAVRQIIGADPNPAITHQLEGHTAIIRNPADAISLGIALVPEDRRGQGALLDFSISQNITLSSLKSLRGISGIPIPSQAAERACADTFLAQLSIIAPSRNELASNLSGGNQQKVVLGRCLATDVDVLILDEPTHGIDVDAKESIYALIRNLASAGKAIILISSELPELVALADRALVLREGVLAGELAGQDLTEQNILSLCFAPEAVEAVG